MHHTLRSFALTTCTTAMFMAAACDSKKDTSGDEPAAAKAKDESAPTKKADETPKPTPEEDPAEAAPQAPTGPSESEVGPDGIPKAVADVVTLPEGSERMQIPQASLFYMMAPKGTKLGRPDDKGWSALTSGDLTMAVKAFNPSGDDHPDCPSLDDLESKLGNVAIETEQSFSTRTDKENTSYGEEAQLVLFKDGDAYGFYARKLFDHGDDATTYCCTPGTPADADTLAGRTDEATARQLAAICMSLEFTF